MPRRKNEKREAVTEGGERVEQTRRLDRDTVDHAATEILASAREKGRELRRTSEAIRTEAAVGGAGVLREEDDELRSIDEGSMTAERRLEEDVRATRLRLTLEGSLSALERVFRHVGTGRLKVGGALLGAFLASGAWSSEARAHHGGEETVVAQAEEAPPEAPPPPPLGSEGAASTEEPSPASEASGAGTIAPETPPPPAPEVGAPSTPEATAPVMDMPFPAQKKLLKKLVENNGVQIDQRGSKVLAVEGGKLFLYADGVMKFEPTEGEKFHIVVQRQLESIPNIQKLLEAGDGRILFVSPEAETSEPRRASGLFVEETEELVERAQHPNPPTPGGILEGIATGIRTADDALERTLDIGAYKLDQWIGPDIPVEQQKAFLRRIGVSEGDIEKVYSGVTVPPKETLPDYEPGMTRDEKAMERAVKEARELAEEQLRVHQAEEQATAQRAVLTSPEGLDPTAITQAHQELQATHRVILPEGTVAAFGQKGAKERIVIERGVSRTDAITQLFRGEEYRDIIAHSERSPLLEVADKIQYVELHAQKLASFMKVRDFMVSLGLTDTDEFGIVQQEIDQEVDEVSKFGHVVFDDPAYGQPAKVQTPGQYIEFGGKVKPKGYY